MGNCIQTEEKFSKLGNNVVKPKTPDDVLESLVNSLDGISGLAQQAPDEFAALKDRLNDAVKEANGADRGSSLFDVQRGFFNLLQGAAYRVYDIRYAMDYHTHTRDPRYPYLFGNFVKYVRAAMELLKSLEVVDPACYPALDDLADSVEAEEKKIRDRIKTWTDEQEAEFSAEEKRLEECHAKQAAEKKQAEQEAQRKQAEQNRKAAASKKAKSRRSSVWLGQTDTKLKDWTKNEGFSSDIKTVCETNEDFLRRKNRIILDDTNEKLPGCWLEISFWYEVFFPKLLKAVSVKTARDMKDTDEKVLDAWFNTQNDSGEFDFYGKDIAEGWAGCSRETKEVIKRSWRFAVQYLHGPQKQRERGSETGQGHRDTGEFSQYIVFVDVYLNRSYVRQAGMRLSFPYFIGPTTWALLHTMGERAAQYQEAGFDDKADLIVANFKKWFMPGFLGLYPCPYCRHHLNDAVVLNKEVDMYPVEFLFVGWNPSANSMECKSTPTSKLSYIQEGVHLRLFLWQLHNAVNSSTARSEDWYQTQMDAMNTTRYWPSLEAELFRADARSGIVSSARVEVLLKVLKPAIRLSRWRKDILSVSGEMLEDMLETTTPVLQDVRDSIVETNSLQQTWGYNSSLPDPDPPDREWFRTWGHLFRSNNFTIGTGVYYNGRTLLAVNMPSDGHEKCSGVCA